MSTYIIPVPATLSRYFFTGYLSCIFKDYPERKAHRPSEILEAVPQRCSVKKVFLEMSQN